MFGEYQRSEQCGTYSPLPCPDIERWPEICSSDNTMNFPMMGANSMKRTARAVCNNCIIAELHSNTNIQRYSIETLYFGLYGHCRMTDFFLIAWTLILLLLLSIV